MARMCEMTLACATILVAGTVASAGNKLAANQDAAGITLGNGPTNIHEAIAMKQARGGAGIAFTQGPLDPDPQLICECKDIVDGPDGEPVWDNGNWINDDTGNGQTSHEGGSINLGAKVADDFFLCDGQIYKLRGITGVLLTDSLAKIRRARLEVYSDCNGCPADLLFTLTRHETPKIFASLGDGFYAVEYNFVIANQPAPLTGAPDLRSIILRGGTYWVSLVGLSDGQGTDSSFWATANGGNVKGSVAKKIDGLGNGGWGTNFSYPPNSSSGVCNWAPLDECCIGCVDMAFQVCADPCKILKDNGGSANTGSISEKSLSTRNSRSADDFVVRNCVDFELCYIEGCILTNCVDFNAFAEIYRNDCKLPTPNPAKLSNTAAYGPFYATKIVRLPGLTATIEGRNLLGYRAEFCLDDVAVGDRTLDGGQNYWLSIGVEDTFSFNERAYFCHNTGNCLNPSCTVMFNPAAWYSPSRGVENWTSQGNNKDHSFLVAGTEITDGSPLPAGTTCVADFDLSGTVDADDIFAFLNAWFTGCP